MWLFLRPICYSLLLKPWYRKMLIFLFSEIKKKYKNTESREEKSKTNKELREEKKWFEKQAEIKTKIFLPDFLGEELLGLRYIRWASRLPLGHPEIPENICINSQNGRFLKLGGPTESACMSDKLKWVRFRQAASSIDQHRGKEVANLKIAKESGSGLRKGRETVPETTSWIRTRRG